MDSLSICCTDDLCWVYLGLLSFGLTVDCHMLHDVEDVEFIPYCLFSLFCLLLLFKTSFPLI